MVSNLEELTRSASDAAADINRLQNEVTFSFALACGLLEVGISFRRI
jgi:hypothetical protein